MKQVALVVGASRGIGRQIAMDLARNGYAVVVAAKTASDAAKTNPFPPDPNSPQSTISTVVREIREAGGEAIEVTVDVRDFASIERMVSQTIEAYSRLDALVYNSGAIWWASVEKTPFKRFQLMQRVNPEGLYGTVQACLPYFEKSGWKGRIIVVSPPIYSRFFRGKTAYAVGKIGMSVLTKGMSMDFAREGKADMAITSIWPASAIQSGATRDAQHPGQLRKATIFSDAILAMLKAPTSQVNGLIDTDEDYLRDKHGLIDFSKYSLVPGAETRRIMGEFLRTILRFQEDAPYADEEQSVSMEQKASDVGFADSIFSQPAKFPDLTVAEQDDEGQRVDSTERRRSKL